MNTEHARSARIIRRRVVWLVGKWVGQDVSPQTNLKVNQLVGHTLRNHPSNDLATRLAATTTLKNLDTWEDDVSPLLPILGPVMSDLSQLLGELELPETRRHVVNVLGHVITRAGRDVSFVGDSKCVVLTITQVLPYLAQLVQVLPALFEDATDQNVFQSEIVATMQSLVNALGPESEAIHGICCQFIQFSCSPDSVSQHLDFTLSDADSAPKPSHIFLQEDGLALWQSLVSNTITPSKEIVALAPLCLALLAEGSEITQPVLRIAESYMLLIPETFTTVGPIISSISVSYLPVACSQQHGSELLHRIASLLQSLDNEATKPTLYTVDILLQSAPTSVWGPAIEASALVSVMLDVVVSDVSVCRPAANFRFLDALADVTSNLQASAVQITRQLCTLARIAITDVNLFHHLVNAALHQAPLAGKANSNEDLLKKILAGFLDRVSLSSSMYIHCS